MKTLAVSTINIYQLFFSNLLLNLLGVKAACRFDESCSSFTKRMIIEKGVVAGIFLGFKRILRCEPISS